MARLGIDVREPLSDHVLLRETHLRELRGAHDREAQVRTEEHADARGRVAKRFVQPEALRLGLGARLFEIDVGARDAAAEVPPDAERDENSDHGEKDRRAGQSIRERERGRRRFRKDDDPTGERCRREGDEAVAAGGVARGDGARRPGETLAHLGKRVLIRQRVAGAPGADELVTEPIDDAQLDRGAGHDVIQLLLDVREGERTGEHPLGPVVEGDRDREDDGLRVQRPARGEHGPDAVFAGDRGLEVVAVRDIHTVRGRGKTREVPAIPRGEADGQPVRIVLDDRPQDRVHRVDIGAADRACLGERVQRREVARDEAVGGPGGRADQRQSPGGDTLAPGLGLLADDGRLDQHQREGRERDDGDDPQAFSAERPGSCLHHVTLKALSRRARLVARMVEPWLRSRA